MAGVEVQIHGLDGVQAMLERMRWRLTDLRPVLRTVAAEMESQTRRRFVEEKTAPEGDAWRPWSEGYAATRQGGQSLLMGEGHLLSSLRGSANRDEARVGSGLVYAAIHQFGGEGTGNPRSRNLPARPYLGLTAENLGDIEVILEEWIAGRMM